MALGVTPEPISLGRDGPGSWTPGPSACLMINRLGILKGPMFDQDQPRAREKAVVQRVLQSTDDVNEVFISLEYSNLEDANEARDRLVSSGVLDRFEDTHGPNVLVDAG